MNRRALRGANLALALWAVLVLFGCSPDSSSSRGSSSGNSSSTSGDSARETQISPPDVYSIQYNASYLTCSHDPQETFRQAGTTDPIDAALWLAEGTKEGPAHQGAYEGCLDGLQGRRNKLDGN